MNYSRRDMARMLPALAASAAAAPDGQPLVSTIYRYEDLPVRTSGQNQSRAVLDAQTHSAFPVELHMTSLGPGQAPHPPHHHVHEEILMLRTGALDVTMGGRTTRITAGSVVSVASNVEHGWRNPGPDRAEYFVMALGQKA